MTSTLSPGSLTFSMYGPGNDASTNLDSISNYRCHAPFSDSISVLHLVFCPGGVWGYSPTNVGGF